MVSAGGHYKSLMCPSSLFTGVMKGFHHQIDMFGIFSGLASRKGRVGTLLHFIGTEA